MQNTIPAPITVLEEAVLAAAEHVYDEECALHAAHSSHVDQWINAAGDRLHDALTVLSAAEHALAEALAAGTAPARLEAGAA